MKRVGLLGFGKIGQYLYEHLRADGVEFSFIYGQEQPADSAVQTIFTTDKEKVLARCQAKGVDLVIECATSAVVEELGASLLAHTDILIFSVTALAKRETEKALYTAAEQCGHTLYIPHGAIIGLDGIRDGRDIIQSVVIKTSKRPQNLGLTNTAKEVVFSGSTREACHLFPRNVNVHAAVALAGLGFDRTVSEIISDPDSTGNNHLIEVQSEDCNFTIQVSSVPGQGVTGAYTPVSALASARRILQAKCVVLL